MTKTNRAWLEIFEDYNVKKHLEEEGFYTITAQEIGQYREARLMAKFDHRSSLPELFQQEKLSILPTKRGEYIISNFDAYEKILETSDSEIRYIPAMPHIKSIDPEDIYSESISLNFAFISGILEDFFETDEIYHTLSGRMGSSEFDFNINNSVQKKSIPISVQNAQVEIDGGYETRDTLYLVEAKNSIPSDFLIRQLYYPYRLWKNKFNEQGIQKDVSTVFLTYSNDIWDLFEYRFEDYRDYNSLRMVNHQRYMVMPDKILLKDIEYLINNTQLIEEPRGIPYPQANSMSRIINLLEILMKHSVTKERLFVEFNTNSLDKRQIDYYLNAGRYLGLIREVEVSSDKLYGLTLRGREIMSLPFKEKNLNLAKEILKNPSFNATARLHLTNEMSQENIVDVMKKSNVYNVNSDATYIRRSSTVKAWIQWIFDLINF